MREILCPECKSNELAYSSEETHCKRCGLVLEDSPTEEFSKNASPTSIAGTKGVNGRIVKESWLYNIREKSLNEARIKIELYSSRLSLPKYVKEQAHHLYQQALDLNLCVGRNSSAILSACIYSACLKDVPKTATEITEYSEISEKQMLRAYKLLQRGLGLKTGFYDPLDLLPRYISRLGLTQETLLKTGQIIESIKKTSAYNGKNPKTIVAAAIYIAAKENKEEITQRKIANAIGVMEVTIRRRCKEIRLFLFKQF